ncbi:hypothetical protein DdX_19757 [Ditylenchus destructor]|uniref:Transmembrane protein n=1 Tax=Ditylenchus destructor TaxID=166010 RepID=A0AAD4MMM1_9BILA|nr:hypothetical protein DdX_19757 [Ditylenchus destructor]
MENVNEPRSAIINLNLANDENYLEQWMPDDLFEWCSATLYFFYPVVMATTNIQVLLSIPYEYGLCLALALAYPFYRILPRLVALEQRWRGWAELTDWFGWEYELYVSHVYAIFGLLMQLRLPFATIMISLGSVGVLYYLTDDDAERNFSARLKRAVLHLMSLFAYFWWHDAVKEGALYEVRKLSLDRCLWWILFFACSLETVERVLIRLLPGFADNGNHR